jgi:hypothetical protein
MRARLRKQKAWLDRVVSDASSVGYHGDDVEGALQIIRKVLDACHRLGELDGLYKTIDEANAASEDRRRVSREYLEKVKSKLMRANARIEELRLLATEPVNFHIGAVTDVELLRTELTPEEFKALGIA